MHQRNYNLYNINNHTQYLISPSAMTGGGPQAAAAHMLQFAPFLAYPSYQLAMAQAASTASKSGAAGAAAASAAPNLAELQRAAELHRQYLLDMIPPQAGQRHNWKT